ncbi:hypothetical protein GM658_14285 [Pseudoduganella eburnea]|uniref:Uncharacterized protein n=1 Tax=Massilia eburnea TaxID=1776165 RepID=A0A6L6QI32_9BURK|nr:Imm51 family immunity protein [Massilia eburnea]MTW11770.1 hypothetical protein [Massilia eburnea]
MQIAKLDWAIPKNISEIVAAEEMWEDERWSPLLLTVIGGTSYKGRDIPLSWQIEFEPSDELFDEANQKIEALGVEPDGYGWANVIASVVAKYHPELADELQFGDTEEDACVVWVESEESCQTLMYVIWSLVHDH